MGKKRGSEVTVFGGQSDQRYGCDPVDQNGDWREIYSALKAEIGEWPAFNWFSHCRFMSVHQGVIRLEHWGGFQAEHALTKYGHALCVAAEARSAVIRYSGGTRPAWLEGVAVTARPGDARYSLPMSREMTAQLGYQGEI